VKIGLYAIRSLKEVDVKVVDFKKFKFNTRSFNLYDPHGLCRDHYVRVYYPWLHWACHWPEEDPWRYFYKSSRPDELVRIAVEWLAMLKATIPHGEVKTTIGSIKFVKDKGNRKISESTKQRKATSLRKTQLWKR